MKRLVIYFHYDPAGCIDTACRIAVQAVQKYGRVVFVTNGTLAPADRVWVRQSGAGRIERENVGFDVGAYREALLTLGREKLAEYEEIVLMNYTLAGPVCSLAAMFTAMDARPELDFWGLTRHYAMQSRRFGGAVPEHLQSHFIAVRPRLFNSDDFWNYWQEMALPTSYEQSIIRIGREQAAPFEKRAAAVCQQLPRAGHNGVYKNRFQVVRLHVSIPVSYTHLTLPTKRIV